MNCDTLIQWLDDPNLSPVEKLLLYKLACHIEQGDDRPSIDQLRKEVMCSVWDCHEGIRGLIKLGLLVRKKVSNGVNKGCHYRYAVNHVEFKIDGTSSSYNSSLSTTKARSILDSPGLTEGNELRLLGPQKMSPGVARQILETKGREYVRELAAYAEKHGKRNKAGYAWHLYKTGWEPEVKVAEPCWRCFVPVEPGLTHCPNCGEGVKEARNG